MFYEQASGVLEKVIIRECSDELENLKETEKGVGRLWCSSTLICFLESGYLLAPPESS